MPDELLNKVVGLCVSRTLFLTGVVHRFIVRVVDRGVALRQLGWVVASLSTSCSANVSLALMCALYRSAENSAAALRRETVPKGHLVRPSHAWGEAWVASVIVGMCRVASCHGALFSRVLIPNHSSVRCCDRW